MRTTGNSAREQRNYFLVLGVIVATYPLTLGVTTLVLGLYWKMADFGFPFDFPLLALCLGGGHLIVALLFALSALGERLPRLLWR